MLKKLNCMLFTLLLLLLIPVQVFAEAVDTDNSVQTDKENTDDDQILTQKITEKLGSITITLEDTRENLSKKDVIFAVIQVADVVNGEFVLTEAFESVKVDLNHIQTANELEAAARTLQEIDAEEKILLTTDTTGTAKVTELPVGVYLVYAKDIADYDNIISALISIPTYNDVEGMMVYDVVICPKHEPIPKQTTVLKTGLDDHVLEYAAVSIILLFGAVIILISACRKSKKRK